MIHITVNVDNIQLRDFQVDTSASGTSNNIAVNLATSTNNCVVRGLKVGGTNTFRRGIYLGNGASRITVIDNEIINASLTGIEVPSNVSGFEITNNYIRSGCSSGAIVIGDGNGGSITRNIISGVSGDCINLTNGSAFRAFRVENNTLYNGSADGIEVTTAIASCGGYWIVNNNIYTMGGTGIKFSGSGVSADLLAAVGCTIEGNNVHTCTTALFNPSGLSTGNVNFDPQFTNAGSHDFSVGTNIKAKGYPVGGTLAVGKYSATASYVDPGAAQRQEAGGGGGGALLRPVVMSGGFV